MGPNVYCAVLYKDCNPKYYYNFNTACSYIMTDAKDYPKFNETDKVWETKNGYVERLDIQ